MNELKEWRNDFLDSLDLAAEDARWASGYLRGETYDETVELAQARIPERFAAALPAEPGLTDWMRDAVRAAYQDRRIHPDWPSGPSRLLVGLAGRGKTHQAFGVVRGLAACGIRINWQYVTQVDYYARLRPRQGIDPESEYRTLAGARLLILDDIGVAKESDWTAEALWRLVDYRYSRNLRTIFISNLLPDRPAKGELSAPGAGGPTLPEYLGRRVNSRLADMAQKVTLKGPDRRGGACTA
jgi:DNA replication protein DnaC